MNVSLLFPRDANADFSANTDIKEAYDRLSLTDIVCSKIADYHTKDARIIEYRLALFEDIMRVRGMRELVYELKRATDDFKLTCGARSSEEQRETAVSRLTDMSYYIAVIELIRDKTEPLIHDIKSKAILGLYDYAVKEASSEEFKSIKANLKELSKHLSSVKSVTIGVNLNSFMRPYEAGLVSFNNQYYKSGSFIDRLMRMDFSAKDKQYHTISPLSSISESDAGNGISDALNLALDELIAKALKKCRAPVKSFLISKNTDIAPLATELSFVCDCSKFLFGLLDFGHPLCIPRISQNTQIKKLYDITPISSGKPPVFFDSDGSTDSRALQIANALFAVGMPVPAEKAEMKINL